MVITTAEDDLVLAIVVHVSDRRAGVDSVRYAVGAAAWIRIVYIVSLAIPFGIAVAFEGQHAAAGNGTRCPSSHANYNLHVAIVVNVAHSGGAD